MQIAHARGHPIFLSNGTKGGLASGQAIFPDSGPSSKGRRQNTNVSVNAETSTAVCQKHELVLSQVQEYFSLPKPRFGGSWEGLLFPRTWQEAAGCLAALDLGKLKDVLQTQLQPQRRCPVLTCAQLVRQPEAIPTMLRRLVVLSSAPNGRAYVWKGHVSCKRLLLLYQIYPFFPQPFNSGSSSPQPAAFECRLQV